VFSTRSRITKQGTRFGSSSPTPTAAIRGGGRLAGPSPRVVFDGTRPAYVSLETVPSSTSSRRPARARSWPTSAAATARPRGLLTAAACRDAHEGRWVADLLINADGTGAALPDAAVDTEASFTPTVGDPVQFRSRRHAKMLEVDDRVGTSSE
jgi:hypothetical protein